MKTMVKKSAAENHDIVQIQNWKTKRYLLIDRTVGHTLEHREEDGPYPNVPIVSATAKKRAQNNGTITQR